ncbi:outer membrane protein assembly factor BamA [Spirochaetia bacterium]|nr:outer membrane protein assembly factor BamA [Spirochaetia bacterium]
MRLKLIVILLLTVVFSSFAQSSDRWYVNRPIRNISFNGLIHVERSELQAITDFYIEKEFSDSLYAELLSKLYDLDYFENIQSSIERDGSDVRIRFIVTELPTVSRIIFSGNSNIRRTELMELIYTKENSVASSRVLAGDEAAIIRKYREKGFSDIQVKSTVAEGQNRNCTVTFTINEGQKVVIGAFEFEGNTIFNDNTLKKQLSLKTKGLLNDGAFEESKLLADQYAIVQYYRDRGYVDVRLVDTQQQTSTDSKGNKLLTIIFKLEEGRQYKFGGITFDGNQIFSNAELSALVYSKVGETINAQRIETDIQRIIGRYYESGYLNIMAGFTDANGNQSSGMSDIWSQGIRDRENGTISFRLFINERGQGRSHIEHIIIRGNSKVRDNVILREIPLEPGEIFSQAKIYNGLRNLYNLQYFSNILPDTQEGSADNLVDLIFSVEEQQTIELSFGLTFSGVSDPDTFPISGMLQYTDRNFLRTGNIMSVAANVANDTQTASVEYTQRWLFGIPLSVSAGINFQHTFRNAALDNVAPFFNGDESKAYPDGFTSYEEYIGANKVPPDAYLMKYDQWYMSLGLSTGYQFYTPVGNLTVSGGIRTGFVLNSFNENILRPFDPVLRDSNAQWRPANSLWTSVALDQRDIFYDPTKGYYAMTRLGLYGVFNSEIEHYARSDTKAEIFWNLFEAQLSDTYSFRLVLGLHTGFSFIFPQAGRDLMVENSNRLAVDGMFNARGWSNVYHQKGLALWENWIELRIPLVRNMLAWDFFFDMAGISNPPDSLFSVFPNNMFFSYGGGLRFTIPQLPFRLSIAKRFQIQEGKVVWQKGGIGAIGDNPATGMDFVLSFSLSSY